MTTCAVIEEQQYTTALTQAQGIIPESLELFHAWKPGEPRADFVKRALDEGILASATERRAANILKEGFAARFLSEPAIQAAPTLRKVVLEGLSQSKLHPILLIYAFRHHLIFREFLTEIYWPRVRASSDNVTKRDTLELIERGESIGRFQKTWSPSVKKRVSAYVLGVALGSLRCGWAAEDRALSPRPVHLPLPRL